MRHNVVYLDNDFIEAELKTGILRFDLKDLEGLQLENFLLISI
jgi:hypothetical protein